MLKPRLSSAKLGDERMEQRHNKRKSVILDVVVSCARVGLFRGQAKDASLGGMYVSSDTVSLPLDASVTITFHCMEKDIPRCFNAQGVVAHQSERGFGLRFERLDHACRMALKNMLGEFIEPEHALPHSA